MAIVLHHDLIVIHHTPRQCRTNKTSATRKQNLFVANVHLSL